MFLPSRMMRIYFLRFRYFQVILLSIFVHKIWCLLKITLLRYTLFLYYFLTCYYKFREQHFYFIYFNSSTHSLKEIDTEIKINKNARRRDHSNKLSLTASHIVQLFNSYILDENNRKRNLGCECWPHCRLQCCYLRTNSITATFVVFSWPSDGDDVCCEFRRRVVRQFISSLKL